MELLFNIFWFLVYCSSGLCQLKRIQTYQQTTTVGRNPTHSSRYSHPQPNWKHIADMNQNQKKTSLIFDKHQPTRESGSAKMQSWFRNKSPPIFSQENLMTNFRGRDEEHYPNYKHMTPIYNNFSIPRSGALGSSVYIPYTKQNYGNNYHGNAESSYTSVDGTENYHLSNDQSPDMALNRQGPPFREIFGGPLGPAPLEGPPLNETELLALRIEEYLLHKEKYFYHKGKIISGLVIALYGKFYFYFKKCILFLFLNCVTMHCLSFFYNTWL